MGDATFCLRKCACRAHLWRPAPHQDLVLCRTRSTFPRMTDGNFSGILESVQAVGTTTGWVRKGRDHETVAKQSATGGSGRREALCLLRCHPPGLSHFESDMVIGVLAAGGYEPWNGPVSGLPPARHGVSHRRLGQRPPLGGPWAIAGPAECRVQYIHADTCGGQGQVASLTCPPFRAWADGRRNDL
jgi:hypothetical protein